MAWPKEVPVLTAKDIWKGDMNGPRDTHCLIGWCRATFGGTFESQTTAAISAVREQCKSSFGESSLVVVNDRLATKQQSADLWNRAMRRLGYTEIQDA